MAKVEENQLERLESDLNVARIRKLRAQRELETLERQSGFMDGRK